MAANRSLRGAIVQRAERRWNISHYSLFRINLTKFDGSPQGQNRQSRRFIVDRVCWPHL